MILNNDPGFTHLQLGIGDYDYFLPPGDDWGILGRAIGNNQCIHKISVYNWRANGQLITTENLVGFLSGFASNRSIRKLSIANWDFSDVGIQDNLIRFFTDNQTIESLIVREKRKRGDGWKVRISALGIILKSFNSLKEISLSSDDEDPHNDLGILILRSADNSSAIGVLTNSGPQKETSAFPKDLVFFFINQNARGYLYHPLTLARTSQPHQAWPTDHYSIPLLASHRMPWDP